MKNTTNHLNSLEGCLPQRQPWFTSMCFFRPLTTNENISPIVIDSNFKAKGTIEKWKN